MRDFYCRLFIGTYEWMVKVEKVNGSANRTYLSWSTLLAMALAHFSLIYSMLILFDVKDINLNITYALAIGIVLILWGSFIKGRKYQDLLEKSDDYKKKAFRFSLVVNSVMISSFFLVAFYKIAITP